MSTRPITDTLRHIGGGVFIDIASDKLAELVSAVDASGKSGKIDLSITVKKATRGGAMHISGKVKMTKPAEEAMEALLFATPEGNLVADDPRQLNLALKVAAGTADVSPSELKTA
jgi:hypothetical protein